MTWDWETIVRIMRESAEREDGWRKFFEKEWRSPGRAVVSEEGK